MIPLAQLQTIVTHQNEPSDQASPDQKKPQPVRLGTLLIQTNGRVRKPKLFIPDSPQTNE